MKGFIRKDLTYLRFQRAIVLIIVFFAVFFPLVTDTTAGDTMVFICGYVAAVSGVVSVSTISYDEMDNGLLYLLSMPISRKRYVQSKYVVALLYALLAVILSVILAGVVTLIAGGGSNLQGIIRLIVIIFAACLIVSSIGIPANLRFGGQRGALVMIGTILILIVVCAGVAKLLAGLGLADLSGYWTWLLDAQHGMVQTGRLSLTLLAAAAVVVLISYLISKRVMQRKEL